MKRRKSRISQCIIAMLCMSMLTGCSKDEKKVTESAVPIMEQKTEQPKQQETEKPTPSPADTEKKEPEKQEIDLSHEFMGLKGCAIMYKPSENKSYVYKESMCKQEVSPYSTFKIVSTLIGLHNGAVTDTNSHMKYNGKEYEMPSWNHDLILKEAFHESCVWYYRQLIDAVGQNKTKAELDQLEYGNCDVSEWKGSNGNEQKDLNGFWLNSSLKISPEEQVKVLNKIFEGKSQYSKKEIGILKQIMLFDQSGDAKIYGKTGTGNGHGWYVGVCEKKKETTYFAVYLENPAKEKQSKGSVARKIAIEALKKI